MDNFCHINICHSRKNRFLLMTCIFQIFLNKQHNLIIVRPNYPQLPIKLATETTTYSFYCVSSLKYMYCTLYSVEVQRECFYFHCIKIHSFLKQSLRNLQFIKTRYFSRNLSISCSIQVHTYLVLINSRSCTTLS